MAFFMLRYTFRPLATALMMVAKVVICQYHGSRILGNLGAGDAHGHSDVRLLKGRRIIDSVSGHGRDGSAPLPCVHDAHFILR